jgi:imidazoleglycerol-phosphate dehydratase
MTHRKASIERTTHQATVKVVLEPGTGERGRIQTGSPFLDRMLGLFARHGGLDLDVQCTSDRNDEAILAEEVAACLGLALNQALAGRPESACFGHSYALVDEHLARAVVEISGQPGLVYGSGPAAPAPGPAPVEAFWRAFASHARLNLHIELLGGSGGLPANEAVFKAVARALKAAAREAGEG